MDRGSSKRRRVPIRIPLEFLLLDGGYLPMLPDKNPEIHGIKVLSSLHLALCKAIAYNSRGSPKDLDGFGRLFYSSV
jgi:hypothetical protein